MRPCWELIHCQPDKKAGKGRIIQVLSVVVAESNSPRTLRNKNLTLQYWGLPFGWQSNFVKSILETPSEVEPSQFATHGDRKGHTQAKWIKNDNLKSLWMPPRHKAEWSFISSPILSFGIKCGWMIYSRPKPFYCGDGAPQSTFNRQLSDHHTPVWNLWRRKKTFALAETSCQQLSVPTVLSRP
jgi:hypothetical protein